LEVWEKVLVDAEWVEEDVHAQAGCIACHGGVSDTDVKEDAHEGMVAKVSADPEKACGSCHVGVVDQVRDGIHRMQWGYQEVMGERGLDFTKPDAVTAYTTHCTSCHADCGDCHISRPSALDGGLLSKHKVKRVGNVNYTCGGCHGARVSDEYKGKHEGIPADVHWEKQGMPCTTCHSMEEYHEGAHGTRYSDAPNPACTDCHETVKPGDGILEHAIHMQKVACQVCHSVGEYKSCYNCHTGRDDKNIPYFTTDESQMTFKIGHNPAKNEDRPWDWVLVRHAPATPGLFDYYGDNLLPDFDSVPTWKYTTPHNMRRITPQNESCNNCHGQDDLFLLAKDVDPAERAANSAVIVEKAPIQLPEGVAP